jgi:hypothetical protein
MKVNSLFIYIILGLLILGGIFLISKKTSTQNPTSQPTPPANSSLSSNIQITDTQIIEMKPDSFVPDKITVKKNTKITFKNEDNVARWPASNIHPTHGIYPEFDPKRPIQPGDEWDFVFDKPGIWRMHDHLIPSITGTIEVIE